MAEDEQGPIRSKSGVVSRDPYARTFTRMRSGTVDAGVRSTAKVEAPRPKPRPPMQIVQPMAMIDRPSERWTEPPSKILGALPSAQDQKA